MRRMKCKACVLFGTKQCDLVVGCSVMKSDRLARHHSYGDSNGHHAALKLLKQASFKQLVVLSRQKAEAQAAVLKDEDF